jgi:phosphoribosylamine--glycine ligase
VWAQRWSELGQDLSPQGQEALVARALAHGVEAVVVGPEAPLAAGLADRLRRQGVPVLGPGAEAARLESSKSWAKERMARWGVPTARAEVFSEGRAARERAAAWRGPGVVKADGLREGKGVVVTRGGPAAAAAVDRRWREGEPILLEERLRGVERSLFMVTDGRRAWYLPPAQDYKRRYAGGRGPNTGGMGAISPPPREGLPPARWPGAVAAPTLAGLAAEGLDYRGVLYFGLMVNPKGPEVWVVEYNSRLGDPEAEAVLPRLQGAFTEVVAAAALGRGGPPEGWLPVRAEASAAVVLAAPGYPRQPRPVRLEGDLRPVDEEGTLLFAGAVEGPPGGPWQGTGGRLVTAVALGSDPEDAARRAMARLDRIHAPGASYRRDIGR